MHKGINKLSLIGRGKHSTNMATAAPTSAGNGEMKTEPAKTAKRKPAADPSKLLSLLKGNGVLDRYLPKMEAVLSPRAKIAMAALLAEVGNSKSVKRMPKAKYTGAKTTW